MPEYVPTADSPIGRAGTDRRHLWALVLALLSIPGSTLAWDLPAGGLWIGLPLGIAAIALGWAVRERTAAKVAIVLAGLAVAQMVVWMLVSAMG
jgi:cell division FtsZ-interacting protein ZapD